MTATRQDPDAVPARTRQPTTRWSNDDVRRLIELWSTDLTNKEIAKKLGREESAVAVKASQINLPRRGQMREQPAANSKARVRPCLGCETPFYSSGPGIRFCDPCKDSSEWKNGGDYFTAAGDY